MTTKIIVVNDGPGSIEVAIVKIDESHERLVDCRFHLAAKSHDEFLLYKEQEVQIKEIK